MEKKVKKVILIAMTSILLISCQKTIEYKDNYYLINGKQHVFKVYTPPGWINDMLAAQKYGLVDMFYPDVMVVGPADDAFWVSIYANGLDYKINKVNYDTFTKRDIGNYKQSGKEVKIENESYQISDTTNIINYISYSISGLKNTYKEDVVYINTKTTCVKIVYSSGCEKAYKEYRKDFERFINDFVFLSSDPTEIKKILEEDRKLRNY